MKDFLYNLFSFGVFFFVNPLLNQPLVASASISAK